ncbi:MAG: hypothetical protein LBH03_01065 [Holophagales bacterium]|jgi:predicted RNase H-like HicB family nuclease|nr:hypothetical protein [Holophagales bacterium]
MINSHTAHVAKTTSGNALSPLSKPQSFAHGEPFSKVLNITAREMCNSQKNALTGVAKDGTERIAVQSHASQTVPANNTRSWVETCHARINQGKCSLPAEAAGTESPTAVWHDFYPEFEGPRVLKTDEGCDGYAWEEVCMEMCRWGNVVPLGHWYAINDPLAFIRSHSPYSGSLSDAAIRISPPTTKDIDKALEMLRDYIEHWTAWNEGRYEPSPNRPPNEYQWPSRMIIYGEMVQNDDGEWVGVGPGFEVNIEDGETLRDALRRIAQPYREPTDKSYWGDNPIIQDPGIVILERWEDTISRLIRQGSPPEQQEAASA